MGRCLGWIGPVAYLAAVAFIVLCGVSVLSGNELLNDWAVFGGAVEGFDASVAGWVFLGAWAAAVVWFMAQAAVIHGDAGEDERWTQHMLNVGLASRIVLMPLCVLLSVSAIGFLVAAFGGFDAVGATWTAEAVELVELAIVTEFSAFVLVLPAVLYQVCAATRLANRGLIGAESLVGNVLFALLPTVGFVSMCGLHVNGRESVLDEHDRRVMREMLAQPVPEDATFVEVRPCDGEGAAQPARQARLEAGADDAKALPEVKGEAQVEAQDEMKSGS